MAAPDHADTTAPSGSATAVEPFRIEISDSALDDLRDRLALTRWPEELPGEPWSRGVPAAYLKELAEYWRTSYDWRRQETRLNELDHFITTIDGQRIHFVHARSPEPGALPLVLTHGWPGSFIEFLGLIGPLTDPAAHGGDPRDAFHLVCPSLPGFAFSGPTHEPGWGPRRIATAFAALMTTLGYERYGAHGGDWGSRISRELGVVDPERVVGVHVTLLGIAPPRDSGALAELTESDQAKLQVAARFRADGLGYGAIQGTRPQTLSYALTDSPVGQLAWIIEKFKEWTDSSDFPEDAVDRDTLLTNVTLYWLTATAGSSANLYYETAHSGERLGAPEEPSGVPTAVAVFPKEIVPPIRSFAEAKNNIVRWSEYDRGGHFAALEAPDLLIGDIREFFRGLR